MAINIEQVDAEELPPMEAARSAPRQPLPAAAETEHDRRMMERTMRRNVLRATRRMAD